VPTRRRQSQLITPSATPEEAAAIVAAIERFVRATAPVAAPEREPDRWARVAILEGVQREDVVLQAWAPTGL